MYLNIVFNIFKSAVMLMTLDTVLASYIIDNEITAINCTLKPTGSIPCLQYRINNTYCPQDYLKKKFPHLYKLDPGRVNWPGPPKDPKQLTGGLGVTWKTSSDAGTNYLKGFQIRMIGNSIESFNTLLCTIIDLSNISASDTIALINTTFSVHFDKPGEYEATVESLPLAEAPYTPSIATVRESPLPKYQEYHPNIKVSVQYQQINNTCINMTTEIQPTLDNVDELFLEVVDGHNEKIQSMSKVLNYTQKTYMLCNFKHGNYTLKIRPRDKYFDNPRKCVCYHLGTNDSRACIVCHKYTKMIYIGQHEEIIAGNDENSIKTIVAPIVGTMTAIAILVLTWYFVYKRKHLPCTMKIATTAYLEHQPPTAAKETMYIIYTGDHEAHIKVVQTFTNLLRAVLTDVNIILFDQASYHINSTYSIMSEEDRSQSLLTEAGIICTVHSEWAHRLSTIESSGNIYFDRVPDAADKNFLSILHGIQQNEKYSSKSISVYFSYTADSFIIRTPFLGPLFSLPLNLEPLFKHILCRVSNDKMEIKLAKLEEHKICLSAAIGSSYEYQGRNESWLNKKIFVFHNSLSSDDSGIEIPQQALLRRQRFRSRSADTTSCHMCKFALTNRSHLCSTCCIKQLPRSRTHSCDYSFIPPESTYDETSKCYSWFEEQFKAINTRCEFVPYSRQFIPDDDCITIDGFSV